MQTMLLIITVCSVGVALAAAWLAWRLRAREQQRQQARIAALSAAIHDGPSLREEEAIRPLDVWPAAIPVAGPELPEEAPVQAAAATVASMFSTEAAGGDEGGRRLRPAIAVGAMAGALFVAGVLMSGGGDARAANTAKAAESPVPLELLALRHEQGKRQLTVSGLVRNPPGAQPVRHLAAVVFFFDQAGGFVGSSRAPVDFTVLSPGEESAFTIAVDPAPVSAARYRVSFRRDESGVLPHVDRREKS